jgi:hypothetical protein
MNLPWMKVALKIWGRQIDPTFLGDLLDLIWRVPLTKVCQQIILATLSEDHSIEDKRAPEICVLNDFLAVGMCQDVASDTYFAAGC